MHASLRYSKRINTSYLCGCCVLIAPVAFGIGKVILQVSCSSVLDKLEKRRSGSQNDCCIWSIKCIPFYSVIKDIRFGALW